MIKYNLWAWTYAENGYREWNKTIYRQKELSDEKKEELAGHFADKMSDKYNCNIALYGCNLVHN